jgi:lysozyme
MIDNLNDQLKRDEGEKLVVYRDSKGILTGGVGHNCEAHNEGLKEGDHISQWLSDRWLAADVATAEHILAARLPWVTQGFDPIRRAVLENMCFNMGWGDGQRGLSGFHHTLAMVEAGNYSGASEAMLESQWAKEVGPRALRLSQQMKTGEWV